MLENHYFPFRMELAWLSQITCSPETKLTDNGKKNQDDSMERLPSLAT